MRSLVAFLAAALLAVPAPSSAAEPSPLPDGPDLAQVLREVAGANRDLAMARASTRAAKAEAREARAARLPRLDLSASYTRTGDVMSVPASPSAPIDPAFFTGWKEQWGVHLGARQVLYSGGELAGGVLAASEGEAASELETLERGLALAFQAKELFYRLLLAQEQLAIAREQLENARAHQAQAEERLKAGDASRFEVLQARVRAANLEVPVVSAGRARGEAAAQLSRLMGRTPDPSLAVRGDLAVSDDSTPSTAGTPCPSRRPAVEAAAARYRQAAALADAAGGSRWPRLSLGAAYDTRAEGTGDLFTPRHDNWTAALVLDYTLFDAGARGSRASRATAQSEAAAEALGRAQAGACLDLDLAELALFEARALRRSAAQTVAEAQEAVAIARVGYQAGTSTHLEVADAENGMAAARTRLAESNYRFLAARAQWDLAVGNLPQEVEP